MISSRGKFITALGLPSSGKSSVMAELGKIMQCDAVFLEPEECAWPKAVTCRNQFEYFSCLMWFRSIRVPMLYEADMLRNLGKVVVTDCYYDKVLKYYLGLESTEWMLEKNDAFYKVSNDIAEIDWEVLPNADCVVVFLVDYDDWIAMLKRRGRAFDENASLEFAYKSQNHFINMVEKLNEEKGIKTVLFYQKFSDPVSSAKRLYCQLIENGVIVKPVLAA